MTPDQQDQLRSLPSVAALLQSAHNRDWAREYSAARLTQAFRLCVNRTRNDMVSGRLENSQSIESLLESARASLESSRRLALRPVINATGIVLHTGLGRAPLCDAAVDALIQVAGGYANVELDLKTGQRGRRVDLVRGLLTELTGAEAATVVNNNAAATLLILNEMSEKKKAVVSRGELIEIGGSFRMPDIMAKSGARMCEVGTTNRTRLSDYENAVDGDVGLLVRIHTSNYRVTGFTESVSLAELVELGRRCGIPVFHDLGSGALFERSEPWLRDEPNVTESVRANVDVVSFSGDKLLGGPQCGVIVGTTDVIRRLEANPLMRAFRVDKLTLSALEATLRMYLDADRADRTIPALQKLTASPEDIARRAADLLQLVRETLPDQSFELAERVTYGGGGSLPTVEIPTTVLAWRPSGLSTEEAAAALRCGDPPVIAYVQDNQVILDLRTIENGEFPVLCGRLKQVAKCGISGD